MQNIFGISQLLSHTDKASSLTLTLTFTARCDSYLKSSLLCCDRNETQNIVGISPKLLLSHTGILPILTLHSCKLTPQVQLPDSFSEIEIRRRIFLEFSPKLVLSHTDILPISKLHSCKLSPQIQLPDSLAEVEIRGIIFLEFPDFSFTDCVTLLLSHTGKVCATDARLTFIEAYLHIL